VNSTECGEAGSNGDNGGFNFIQAGWGVCGANADADGNPACSGVFLFVEYEINAVYNCYLVGTPSYGSTHKGGVLKNAGNSNWLAYIDGVAHGPSGGVSIGNAYCNPGDGRAERFK